MLTWPASPQKQGKRVTSSHYGMLLIRRRNSARHLSAPARAERQAPQGANGLGDRAVLRRRAPLREQAGFEAAGSPVGGSRERHLQETYSRRAARVVCGGTTTSETAARVDSRGLSPAGTDRGRRRLRGIELQPL